MCARRERKREKKSRKRAKRYVVVEAMYANRGWAMFMENRADSFVGRELRRFVGINYEYLARSGGEEKRVSRRSSSS